MAPADRPTERMGIPNTKSAMFLGLLLFMHNWLKIIGHLSTLFHPVWQQDVQRGIHRSEERLVSGLVNFVPAPA